MYLNYKIFDDIMIEIGKSKQKIINLIIIINLLISFNEYKFNEIYIYLEIMRMEYLDFL